MARFDTEADRAHYGATYCQRCVHGGPENCPVMQLHAPPRSMMTSAAQINVWRVVQDRFIPDQWDDLGERHAGRCAMFLEDPHATE